MNSLTRFLAFVFLSLGTAATAQDLNVYMAASKEVVGPSYVTHYTLTVTNTGSSDLTGVVATVQLPPSINRFGNPDFSCGSFCDANEQTSWAVGTLAPGESRSTHYLVQYSSSAPAGVASSTATVSATGASDVTSTLDVIVDPSPLLQFNIAPESGPAVAGESFVYTITYGNVGSTSPTDVVLTMPIPEGTTFASATDDGVVSGGVVTWDLGLLGVGTAGQVQLSVNVNGGIEDGDVLEAVAEIDPNVSGEPVMRSSAVTPVRGGVPLRFEYAVSQTALGPGNRLDVSITATNTSVVDLTDVSASLRLPDWITRFGNGDFSCGSFCDPNDRTSWAIGTLGPGESRTTAFRTFVRTDANQGDVLPSFLLGTSTSTGQVSAGIDIHVDPSPLMELDVAPESGPAVAGEPFTYTLSLGNVGSASPTSVVLTMPVPEGATFASATGGGVESGGVVTWDVGTVGVGISRRFQLTVIPGVDLIDGSLLLAGAQLDSGLATEQVIRSSTVTPVRGGVPLRFEYAVSQTALGPGNRLDVSITATNTSVVDLTDVSASLRLPDWITRFGNGDFSCGSFCDPNDRTSWAIGTLGPGESRTTAFRTFVQTDARQGDVLRSTLLATATGASQVSVAQSWTVDPTPLLRLSLSPSPGPATPGQPFTYTLTYGNGGSTATNVVLTMPLPEGAAFVSATGGGAESRGVVTWPVGTLANGEGGQHQLIVLPDATLEDGSILLAEAEIDPMTATEIVVRSSAATATREVVPLQAEYDVSPRVLEPGTVLTYSLTVTNTGGASLTDAVARVRLPNGIFRFSSSDLSCGSFCDPSERTSWAIGTLAPGASRTITFSPTVHTDAARGSVIASNAQVFATGSNEVVLSADVLLGAEVDREAPAAPLDLTATADETEVTLTWTANTEDDLDAYRVYRDTSPDASTLLATVGADATTFVDDTETGTYYYRIRAVDAAGNQSAFSNEVEVTVVNTAGEDDRAKELRVIHAPNPTTGRTQILVSQPTAEHLRLAVYDALGREVAVLLDDARPAGEHAVTWDATGLPAGLYLYRLAAGDAVRTGAVTVVR